MRVRTILLACLILPISLTTPAAAQFREEEDTGGVALGEAQVQRWQAGMIVTAGSGPCTGIVGTAPIPIDWPEQQVTVIEEDVTPPARLTYRTIGGTVKQMTVTIRSMNRGQTCRALITLEIRRSKILAPENTDVFALPDTGKLPTNVRMFLGPSPYIETTHAKIRALAKQIGVDEPTAWGRVEAIYDWVRETVRYQDSPLKGAVAALEDGTGDCEDLTSLFIAVCRAGGIPARTVWVPGHCYPEFYLEDAEGNGHWFPCQVAGGRAFGEIPELRPILQKGDNFPSPTERGKKVRYLPESLTGTGGKPRVQFVRRLTD